MQSRYLITASAALIALAGCSKHDNADNSMAADTNIAIDDGNQVNEAAAMPTDAQGFVNAAAASDRFEIESSKQAATAASSPAVKKFAATMVSDHTASTTKLKSIAGGMNPAVTPDDSPAADQQQLMSSLAGKTGADFDQAYAAAQVTAHQKALDMLKNYSASGDNQALKDFANQVIPKVTAHLNMAKGLK